MKNKRMGSKQKPSTPNTRKGNSRASTSNANVKKRVSKNKTSSHTIIILLALFVLLLVVSFFTIGGFLTAFLGVGILIIVGLAKLLNKLKNKPKRRKVLNFFLIFILAMATLILLLACSFLIYIAVTAPEFDPKELERNEMTIVYDKDGNEITKLGAEMRTKVTYEELPQVFIDALVATEDSRFFQHNGFDAPRFLKLPLVKF